MLNAAQTAFLSAVSKLIKPLVKLLPKFGIDYGTFTEVIRKAYVDAVFEELQDSGKRQTVSSVSAITGLTRKEVKRLKELDMPDLEETHQRWNRCTRVISGWRNDPRFQNKEGEVQALPIDGDEISFTSLVKSYSGDIPPTTMLSVLQAANSVKYENGFVELLQHAYLPQTDSAENIDMLGSDVSELISTIGHNLTCPVNHRLFQRKVSNYHVQPEILPVFKALAAKKAQLLLEDLDLFLSHYETDDNSGTYVALGIYYFDELNMKNIQENTL